jgi:hypothetical protein
MQQCQVNMYGVCTLAAWFFRRWALRERTITIDAMKASFETSKGSRRR